MSGESTLTLLLRETRDELRALRGDVGHRLEQVGHRLEKVSETVGDLREDLTTVKTDVSWIKRITLGVLITALAYAVRGFVLLATVD